MFFFPFLPYRTQEVSLTFVGGFIICPCAGHYFAKYKMASKKREANIGSDKKVKDSTAEGVSDTVDFPSPSASVTFRYLPSSDRYYSYLFFNIH